MDKTYKIHKIEKLTNCGFCGRWWKGFICIIESVHRIT